jgi:hypothetical protein
MITVLYFVIHNVAYMVVGSRYVELIDPQTIMRLWQIGSLEAMIEVPGVWKLYRRVKDKLTEDRSDRIFDRETLNRENRL